MVYDQFGIEQVEAVFSTLAIAHLAGRGLLRGPMDNGTAGRDVGSGYVPDEGGRCVGSVSRYCPIEVVVGGVPGTAGERDDPYEYKHEHGNSRNDNDSLSHPQPSIRTAVGD